MHKLSKVVASGHYSLVVYRLLVAVTSFVAEHGLQAPGLQ